MANIEDIEGIGPAYAEKLRAAGATTDAKLLEIGATKKDRQNLAEQTGISEDLLLKWVNRADLARVKGVGSEYADLLEAAGIDSVPELAQRNATNLHAKLAEINTEKNLVRALPSESSIESWIDHAKTLDKVVTH